MVQLLLLCLLVRFALAFEGASCRVLFVNTGRKDVEIAWIPFDRGEKLRPIARLLPGHEHSEDSFCGHTFALMEGGRRQDAHIKSAGKLLLHAEDDAIVIDNSGAAMKSVDENDPRFIEIAKKSRAKCEELYANSDADRNYFCHRRFDDRMYITGRMAFSDSEWDSRFWKGHSERTEKLERQPSKYMTFTKVGFKVSQIPGGLLQTLRRYFNEGRLSKSKPENTGVLDPNLSGRQSDTWLLDLTPGLRQEVENTMRPILADWARLPASDLRLTAIYGVRMYHNGSVLYTHVDREETHVLSAILELEKFALDPVAEALGHEDWPLYINDHAGKRHKVPNRPGQAILYESATCPHGRDDVYHGREVANIFVHFAPQGWPKKYWSTPGKPRNVHAEL
mmetsp:Transcript_23241/g.41974  ORF Transcript_23241/g.41974 Transcript_23241/m.41974 type:complete len:394 (-) Transcript_23241:66-1247(-)